MLYIWLNEKGEKQLKKRVENWGGEKNEREFLGGVRVETHYSGKKYVQLYDNPIDPTMEDPKISQDLIEKITLKETIYRGFRTEGLYRHEGAILMVKSSVRARSKMASGNVECEEWQEISVRAPNLAALKKIYSMVRQGKLFPEENWQDEQQPVASPAEAPKP